MALLKNEQEALFELKKELQKKYNIIDYRLFGSKAKGFDLPDSDVDLMIELEELNPDIEMEIYKLVYEKNLKYDCFISPLLFSKKEIDEGPMSQSPIYKAIQRDGIGL